MIERDRPEFAEMMSAIYAFHRQECTDSALEIWWVAMKQFDFAAVRRALGQQTMNPDSGQFLPKPADVVKMLGGSTLDSALVAWTKVDRAVSSLGAYHTVVFDDPLIHRVIEEMGSWVVLCKCSAKDWPFRQHEFLNRYRSYKSRGEIPPYPPKLVGIIDGENTAKGFEEGPPLLVGDRDLARKVLAGGSNVPLLSFTPLQIEHAALRALAEKEPS